VYNNDARVNANGGNAYYEEGAAHPSLILADLIAIFHPELLPDHELAFFRRLEAAAQ
jgi:iron complex transport system substrate-binding protein